MSRRDRLAAYLALTLAFALGVAVCLQVSHQEREVSAQAGEREVVIRLYDDGSWQYVGEPMPPPLTPAPTWTPLYGTPGGTSTPRLPTPTREVGITPSPTLAPEKVCTIKTRGFVINERSAPSATASKTDSIQPGSTVKLYEVRSSEAYLWGRTVSGWMAIAALTPWEWWVYGLGASELCVDLPGWPPGVAPPVPIVRAPAWGIWSGPGSPLGEMLTFGDQLKAAGITPAVTLYGNESAAFVLKANGWLVALRPWINGQDCPSFARPARDSAHGWVDLAVEAVRDIPYDWLVLSNECIAPSPQYAAAWIRAAIQRAAERGVPRLVPWVFPPGHPELADVATFATAYANAPLEVAWGMNLYPTLPGRNLGDRGGINEWTVWRWRLYRHQLPEDVPLVVTEFARADGSEPPDFEDIGRFVERSEGAFLWATAWYLAGPTGLGHWPAAVLCEKLSHLRVSFSP